MNLKKKGLLRSKKGILIPALLLVSSLAIGGGSTYALFTSKDSTNIAITSGKVSVSASVGNLALYSPKLIGLDGTLTDATNVATINAQKTEGVFADSGTATLDAQNAILTLDRIAPGDVAEFDMNLTNASTVDIYYRFKLENVSDAEGSDLLFSALEMTLTNFALNDSGSYKYTNLLSFTSAWHKVEAGADIGVVPHLKLKLPELIGNTYQGLSTKIRFTFEAVQANAHIKNESEIRYYQVKLSQFPTLYKKLDITSK